MAASVARGGGRSAAPRSSANFILARAPRYSAIRGGRQDTSAPSACVRLSLRHRHGPQAVQPWYRSATPTRRRSGADMAAVRQAARQIVQTADSLDTGEVARCLAEQGYELPQLAVYQILKGFAAAGHLESLGGKPMRWRAKSRGQTSGSPPTIIRRGQPVSLNLLRAAFILLAFEGRVSPPESGLAVAKQAA
jgi:hypothetical protein